MDRSLVAVLGLTPSPAKALAIYSYIGNDFTSIVDGTLPTGSYTTSMSVSGSFTVAAPLLSLSLLTDISTQVLSFSFSDGRNTLVPASTDIATFKFITDSFGAPTSWQISLDRLFTSPSIVGQQTSEISSFTGFGDGGVIRECVELDSNDHCSLFYNDLGSNT